MILVTVVEPNTDKWKAWVKKCKQETEKIVKHVQVGKPFKINENLYKGKQKSYKTNETFFFNNASPFFGKCVFCEGNIYRCQHGSVEHFRPKNRVEDIKFNVVRVKNGRGEIDHPGYFWLVYDWKNLVPACVLCNERSSIHSAMPIGKGCRFPVLGAHALAPGEETKERPLLINPSSGDPDDNPKKHLYVDKTGVMFWKSKRGKTCIDVFGLNDRDLGAARRETYESANEETAALVLACKSEPNGKQQKKLQKKIGRYLRGEAEYSAAARQGVEDALKTRGITTNMLLGGDA